MEDKVIYNVELTQEESEQIERNRVKPKRQINEKQKKGLEIGHEKLKEKREQRKKMKEETEELEKKKYEKQIKRKIKEEEAIRKLEILKAELEKESSSDDEIIIKKLKRKKEKPSTFKQLKETIGQQPAPVTPVKTIRASELWSLRGF